MSNKTYSQHKVDFDNQAMKYIAKRVYEDIDSTDAYHEGYIDGVGNMLDEKRGWEFTNLDRFILAMKQQLGESTLRDLLSSYATYADVDPLRIMRSVDKPIPGNYINTVKRIVSKIESMEYLDEHRDDGVLGDVDDMELVDRIARALTIASFLLYTLKLGRMPTSIEFKSNVMNSVEFTFYIRAVDNYDAMVEFVSNNGLLDNESLKSSTIRLLVSIAKDMIDGDLLTFDGTRIEDQSKSWKKLGER